MPCPREQGPGGEIEERAAGVANMLRTAVEVNFNLSEGHHRRSSTASPPKNRPLREMKRQPGEQPRKLQ